MRIYAVSQRYPQYTREVRPKKETVYIPPSYPENNVIDAQVAKAYMNTQAISFGYNSILKDLFREGKMPSVTKGIYGYDIDNVSVSLEHLKPHSFGGRSTLSNFALANMRANSKRGNKPLPYFLNNEMLEEYLAQFNFEIKGRFNGFRYQEMIRKTCKDLGVGDKIRTLEEGAKPIICAPSKVVQIDYGNMKDILAHINEIDTSSLSKKMLKSLRERGYLIK